jgi:hypothetical protein
LIIFSTSANWRSCGWENLLFISDIVSPYPVAVSSYLWTSDFPHTHTHVSVPLQIQAYSSYWCVCSPKVSLSPRHMRIILKWPSVSLPILLQIIVFCTLR